MSVSRSSVADRVARPLRRRGAGPAPPCTVRLAEWTHELDAAEPPTLRALPPACSSYGSPTFGRDWTCRHIAHGNFAPGRCRGVRYRGGFAANCIVWAKWLLPGDGGDAVSVLGSAKESPEHSTQLRAGAQPLNVPSTVVLLPEVEARFRAASRLF
jgi:hypothetical protein